MFDHTSRYYNIETATYTTSEGKSIAYKRRRFVPTGQQMQTLAEVTVASGDRLDLITSKTLGNAEQFWRVCDANNTMNPQDLIARPGRTLRIPVPQF